jgi:tyrosine-protein phosphatase SIW14
VQCAYRGGSAILLAFMTSLIAFRSIAVLASLAAMATTVTVPAADADTPHAVPIARFHKVDERLYRGSQPDERGFRALRDLGVRTVINLRLPEDAVHTGEQQIVESLGMRYVNVPVQDGNFFTWFRRIPEDTVRRFFAVLDAEQGPFFVHCRRGTDRTGAMVAFYRMARTGWDAARATAEANDVGMRFWYRGLRRQIKAFDVSQLKAERVPTTPQ